MDHPNIHSPASLYEAFTPPVARRIAVRLEIHFTPKHGNWLNPVEIEPGVLDRKCLDRRIQDRTSLCRGVGAWEDKRNQHYLGATWRFRTAEARIKLNSFYPSVQVGPATSRRIAFN